jgi:hypothetical protein
MFPPEKGFLINPQEARGVSERFDGQASPPD